MPLRGAKKHHGRQGAAYLLQDSSPIFILFGLFYFVKARSFTVAQASIELTVIPLPLPPKFSSSLPTCLTRAPIIFIPLDFWRLVWFLSLLSVLLPGDALLQSSPPHTSHYILAHACQVLTCKVLKGEADSFVSFVSECLALFLEQALHRVHHSNNSHAPKLGLKAIQLLLTLPHFWRWPWSRTGKVCHMIIE